jgi:hypothetical protein
VRFWVERDPVFCGHLNGDVGNSETNLVSLVLKSISLLFLLKFDLTLGVILSEYVVSSCSIYFYMLYSV